MIRVPKGLMVPAGPETGPQFKYLVSLQVALVDLASRFAERINASLPRDGTEAMEGPLELMTYTVATIPAVADYEGTIIYVSDGAAGTKFRGSDGTSWLSLG